MERMVFLFAALIAALAVVILGAVFAEQINANLRHHVKGMEFQGETLLFWGTMGLGAFALGLLVMYLMLRG